MSTLIISSFILTAGAATVAIESTPHRRLISFSTLQIFAHEKLAKKYILKSSTPPTSDEQSSSTAIYLYEATFN